MRDEDTQRQILATTAGLGGVTLCPCGTISLSVGGVSVRMDIATFARTAEMCRTAIAALELHARALQSMEPKKQSMMTH